MHRAAPIRRWRRIGLTALLCLALLALAMAQTQTTTPPKKPANASAASAKTNPTSGHAASHRTSPRTSPGTSARASTPASAQKRKSSHGKKGSRQVAKQVKKKRGQQGIDPARAREIQEALIRQHYLQGEPTGVWDSATQAAMQRFQADQGWQSKTTPDSRALIKLGLGPSHDHLLNPESAITTTTTTTTTTTPAAADPKAGANPAPADNNLPQQ